MEYKKDWAVNALILTAATASATIPILFMNSINTHTDVLLFVVVGVASIVAHEYTHVATIRFMGKRSKVVPILRRVALAVDFDELEVGEYVRVALAPLAVVQTPLSLVALATGHVLAVLLSVYHFLGSLVDIYIAAKVYVFYRGCTIKPYKQSERIAGYAVACADGREVVYMF